MDLLTFGAQAVPHVLADFGNIFLILGYRAQPKYKGKSSFLPQLVMLVNSHRGLPLSDRNRGGVDWDVEYRQRGVERGREERR